MRRGTGIVAVFLMLVMLMPALACAAAPSVTRAQRDCCQKMHGNCGDMTKQGCCAVDIGHDLPQIPAHIVNAPVFTLTLVALIYPLLLDLPASAGHVWQAPLGHSPPGLLIADTTVLRI